MTQSIEAVMKHSYFCCMQPVCVREVQMDNVEWTSKTLPVFRDDRSKHLKFFTSKHFKFIKPKFSASRVFNLYIHLYIGVKNCTCSFLLLMIFPLEVKNYTCSL